MSHHRLHLSSGNAEERLTLAEIVLQSIIQFIQISTRRRRRRRMSGAGKLYSSNSELDLDRPNLEDYLPIGSIQEPPAQLRLYVFPLFPLSFSSNSPTFYLASFWIVGSFVSPYCDCFRRDLLDISPTLTEAAGAIVDVSFPMHVPSVLPFWSCHSPLPWTLVDSVISFVTVFLL